MARAVWFLALAFPATRPKRVPAPTADVRFEPGVDFEPTHLIYHITVSNPGDATVREVVIRPHVVHGSFRIVDSPKSIPILQPGTFGTASFRVDLVGEPSEVELSGRVQYRVGESKASVQGIVPPMRLDLRPPLTRPVYVTPSALKERASRSFSIQETMPLPGDAQGLFKVLVSTLAAEGLEKVEEKTQRAEEEFTGQASFHGLDSQDNAYAVRIVASRKGASTLRLLVFVQAEESLFGFFWRSREALRRALGGPPHQP